MDWTKKIRQKQVGRKQGAQSGIAGQIPCARQQFGNPLAIFLDSDQLARRALGSL